MATNIFSGSWAIFADLRIKKDGSKKYQKAAECFLVKLGSSFTLQTSESKQHLKFAAWTLFTGNCNAEQSAAALVGAEGSPESAVSHMQHCCWVWAWSRCWLWAKLGTSVPMDRLSILLWFLSVLWVSLQGFSIVVFTVFSPPDYWVVVDVALLIG